MPKPGVPTLRPALRACLASARMSRAAASLRTTITVGELAMMLTGAKLRTGS